jgi:CheY-like chemotaxis protein
VPGELILIVEDNPRNLKLIRDVLQFQGYTILEAETGEAGVALALEQQPALILMDVQLPGMDGIEALSHLRADAQTADLRVVALTALAMKDDRERCLAVGMDCYISKPVRANELFESVESCVPAKESEERPGEKETGRQGVKEPEAVFDREEALSRVGGDWDLLRDLAEIFLRECPRMMNDIRAAIESGDSMRLKCAAHSLKGSVDNFAAPAAFQEALRLEQLARSGQWTEVPETCKLLETEVNRLQPALASLIRAGVIS